MEEYKVKIKGSSEFEVKAHSKENAKQTIEELVKGIGGVYHGWIISDIEEPTKINQINK